MLRTIINETLGRHVFLFYLSLIVIVTMYLNNTWIYSRNMAIVKDRKGGLKHNRRMVSQFTRYSAGEVLW